MGGGFLQFANALDALPIKASVSANAIAAAIFNCKKLPIPILLAERLAVLLGIAAWPQLAEWAIHYSSKIALTIVTLGMLFFSISNA